jgi:aryl-alcohol dehydrogenase-like predicted oxidoreductase
MRYDLFGRSGLRVSELFLGTMTFGEQGGVGAPAEECRRIFEAYADAGGTVVDTASNYRDGASEDILGELLAGRRDRFVVMSKYTVSRDRDDPNAAGNHRKNLRLSLDGSLRRLRTDYLAVCWVHVWDRHTPIEETMRALDDEIRAGRILYVGISDTPAWIVSRANTLAEWRGLTPFAGLQPPAARRRTGSAPDGRGVRDGRGGLGATRRRHPIRQVRATGWPRTAHPDRPRLAKRPSAERRHPNPRRRR